MPDEGLALGFQSGAQVGEIVDLAVEDDGVAAAGTGHGLVTCRRQVDDRQADEAEPGRAFPPLPGIVRTTMVQLGNRRRKIECRRAAVG